MTGNAIFTADKIHNGRRFLPEGAAIQVSGNGEIIAVHQSGYSGPSTHLDGILCPGFVNAHCHLELSHMKGVIPEKTGLIPFLQGVMKERFSFTDEQKKAARHEAFNAMLKNGVVAIGDISNITDTLDLRALGTMHFHTFVESIGMTDTHAEGRLDAAKEVYNSFAAQGGSSTMLRQSITPHAPYSVSEKLFKLIDAFDPSTLLSIHNQETAAEDEYYLTKTGEVLNLLHGFGIDDSFFVPSGKSSLQTYLPWLNDAHPIILVHNTFSTVDDIVLAESRAMKPFLCLCPNANLYIEDRLPNVTMLAGATENICLGTDSLSSNHALSILAEVQTLHHHFPQLGIEKLLCWATYNGAKALKMEGTIGSLVTGKTPGLLQLTGLEEGDPVVRRLDGIEGL